MARRNAGMPDQCRACLTDIEIGADIEYNRYGAVPWVEHWQCFQWKARISSGNPLPLPGCLTVKRAAELLAQMLAPAYCYDRLGVKPPRVAAGGWASAPAALYVRSEAGLAVAQHLYGIRATKIREREEANRHD